MMFATTLILLLLLSLRLKRGHECLLLLKRLRIIGATVEMSLIRRAARTIAYSRTDKSQMPVLSMVAWKDGDPGATQDRPGQTVTSPCLHICWAVQLYECHSVHLSVRLHMIGG